MSVDYIEKPFGPGLFLGARELDFIGGDKNLSLVISSLRFPFDQFGSLHLPKTFPIFWPRLSNLLFHSFVILFISEKKKLVVMSPLSFLILLFKFSLFVFTHLI